MNDTQTVERYHTHMAVMVALEHTIEQGAEDLLGGVAHNSDEANLFRDLQELAATHRETLAARLHAIAPAIRIPTGIATTSPLEALYDRAKYPVSAALVSLYSLLGQAIIGYSVLMVLVRRAADSIVRGTDNTDDIVQQHLRDATTSVQRIARLLPDVVVTELEQAGQECQCSCPSCGLGICLCAVSTRRMVAMAWADAGPIYAPGGILITLPRSESMAAQAGLHKGDVVLAVDNKDIESLPMLQETIRDHKSGEEIDFRVQQQGDAQVRVVKIRQKLG